MKKCEDCHGKRTKQYNRVHPIQSGDKCSPVTYHTMECPRCKGSGFEPIKAHCNCNNASVVMATVKLEHCTVKIEGLNVEYDALVARCTKCGEPTNYGGSDESFELMNAETKAGHEAYLKAKEQLDE